jgi:hypothetical protein
MGDARTERYGDKLLELVANTSERRPASPATRSA